MKKTHAPSTKALVDLSKAHGLLLDRLAAQQLQGSVKDGVTGVTPKAFFKSKKVPHSEAPQSDANTFCVSIGTQKPNSRNSGRFSSRAPGCSRELVLCALLVWHLEHQRLRTVIGRACPIVGFMFGGWLVTLLVHNTLLMNWKTVEAHFVGSHCHEEQSSSTEFRSTSARSVAVGPGRVSREKLISHSAETL